MSSLPEREFSIEALLYHDLEGKLTSFRDRCVAVKALPYGSDIEIKCVALVAPTDPYEDTMKHIARLASL